MKDWLEQLARWLEAQVPSGRWHDRIYSYCERGGDSSFWAEPLNAWTNGAFHLAALAALVLWAMQGPGNRRIVDFVLIAIVAVIGAGSFLFHTLATRWAAVADTVPIGIFMVTYLAYALKRWVGTGWIVTFLALCAFFVALWQSSVVRCDGGPCLSGSVAYFPALAVLVVIGGYLAIRGHPAGKYLFSAGAIFAVSLTLRTVDKSWCAHTAVDQFGRIGTHYWWHILNATLLYLLLRAAILHGGRRIPRGVAATA